MECGNELWNWMSGVAAFVGYGVGWESFFRLNFDCRWMV